MIHVFDLSLLVQMIIRHIHEDCFQVLSDLRRTACGLYFKSLSWRLHGQKIRIFTPANTTEDDLLEGLKRPHTHKTSNKSTYCKCILFRQKPRVSLESELNVNRVSPFFPSSMYHEVRVGADPSENDGRGPAVSQ